MIQLNGRELFKFATRVIPTTALQVLENAGVASIPMALIEALDVGLIKEGDVYVSLALEQG